jgi:hypothetical protein
MQMPAGVVPARFVAAEHEHEQDYGLGKLREDIAPCGAHNAHFGRAELAVDEGIVDGDVNDVCDHHDAHHDGGAVDALIEGHECGGGGRREEAEQADVEVVQLQLRYFRGVLHQGEEGGGNGIEQQREGPGSHGDVDARPDVAAGLLFIAATDGL